MLEVTGVVDDYTYTIISTGKSTITVLGHNGLKGSKKKYYLYCDVCSEDQELFGGGLSSTKRSLKIGSFPCGCGTPKWSESQYKVLVRRRCVDRGYKFYGWASKFKGNSTKLLLSNPSTGNLWRSTSINNFLSRGNGDPVEAKSNLADKIRVPRKDREVEIREKLTSEGGNFVDWESLNYKGNSSKFKWICKEGHHCLTSVGHFLNAGNRCMSCANLTKGTYGYYFNRTEEDDNLYVIRFKNDSVIKVGRAFDVEARISDSRGLLKSSGCNREDIEILCTMTGKHQQVYDTEQWIHGELTTLGFHAHWITWTSECFTEDSEAMIYKLLKDCTLIE